MVEGARIDMAHHDNYAKLALIEAVEFDEAVAAAVAMTDPTDTLIIVTADHSHAAIMNGYPKRNNEILGSVPSPNPGTLRLVLLTSTNLLSSLTQVWQKTLLPYSTKPSPIRTVRVMSTIIRQTKLWCRVVPLIALK